MRNNLIQNNNLFIYILKTKYFYFHIFFNFLISIFISFIFSIYFKQIFIKILQNNNNNPIFLNRNLINNKEEFIITEIENSLRIEPFLLELCKKKYYGDWTINDKNENKKISLPNFFSSNHGNFILYFNYISLPSYLELYLNLIINDNKYNDNYIIIKAKYTLLRNNLNKEIIFNFTDIKKLETGSESCIMKSNISKVSIYKSYKLFKNIINSYSNINNFTINIPSLSKKNINGEIFLEDLPLNIKFESIYSNYENIYTTNLNKKVYNLNIFLLIIGITSTYINLKILRQILSFNINIKNFSPLLIFMNMIWNAIITVFCLILSIIFSNYFNSFLTTGLFYFMNFCIVEMKYIILFIKHSNEVTRFRQNMIENNMTTNFIEQMINSHIQKKIFKFNLLFYITLIFYLFFVVYSLIYDFLFFLNCILIFIPQIIYNVNINILKNHLPFNFIIIVLLNKLFLPLYFRLYNNNILLSQPKYFLVLNVFIVLFLELLILFLQQYFGNKFFIPKKFRKGYYNYYKTLKEIEEIFTNNKDKNINKTIEEIENLNCSICLSLLRLEPNSIFNSSSINDNNLEEENKKNNELELQNNINIENINQNNNVNIVLSSDEVGMKKLKRKQIFNKNFLKCFKKNKEQKEIKIMMTPCHHLFHPECLKLWCVHKNQCPICRTELPLIE